MLTNKWGKVTIDRFASHTNKKTQRFNSKYICPGSEGVNAFSVDWSNENNLLVPNIFNSKDDQAFYVIKIFSKGNTGVSILAFFNILATVIQSGGSVSEFH